MSMLSLALLVASAASQGLTASVTVPCDSPDRIEIALNNKSTKPISLHRARLPWVENAASADLRPFRVSNGVAELLETMAAPVSHMGDVDLGAGKGVNGTIVLSQRIASFENTRRRSAIIVQLTIAEGLTRSNKPGTLSRWIVYFPKRALFSHECPTALKLK